MNNFECFITHPKTRQMLQFWSHRYKTIAFVTTNSLIVTKYRFHVWQRIFSHFRRNFLSSPPIEFYRTGLWVILLMLALNTNQYKTYKKQKLHTIMEHLLSYRGSFVGSIALFFLFFFLSCFCLIPNVACVFRLSVLDCTFLFSKVFLRNNRWIEWKISNYINCLTFR